MENVRTGKETVEELFFKFMDAQDCPEITHTFQRLVQLLGIKTDNPREFYTLLKGKLQSWRCKSLWELLDSRANQKEYGKGKICEDTHILVIGAGPIGLRTAIEVALLGAQVVIVEKRESFTRNNVLHLWPFLLTDFRSLGAKKFYGKFCSGSIDHISIRKLQATLLKTALIFGAKLHAGVSFDHVIEPNSTEDCWRCKVSPDSHSLNEYEFDVLIGADGKKNVIPGFQQIEMRGTLAIGITANFVNHGTEAEANAEEISGIAYQFNPQFFDDLHERKGIKLENIVYYKDETHYFVMTAGKASLLKRGALKEDLNPSSKLLATSNIDHSKLLEYVTDVVKYATKGTLKNLELKLVANKLPDIAAFDFTSIKKAEHAARIVERKGSKLLVGLVGDSLLEPFWPTGSGCARGVLSALDAAWMVRSFAQEKPPLQILSERENIYRLLSGTSAENLHKTHAKYTINPSTRYLHITQKRIREVYHLYDTDDPVNADFSIGSPQTGISIKASRKRRISTGAKPTAFKGRRGRASSHLAAEFDRVRSTSGSSMENMVSHKPLAATKSEPLDSRFRTHTLGSIGSDDEVFKTKTRRVKMKSSGSPMTGRRGRSSTIGSSADELKDKKRRTGRKRTISRDNLESPKEKTHRKRGFFGFGIGKQKRKADEEPTQHADKNSKSIKWKRGESVEEIEHKRRNGVVLTGVQKREENPLRMSGRSDRFTREESWRRGGQAGSFSREQYTRRSARDIIREMEARAKGESVSSPGTVSEGGQKEPRKLSPGNIRGRQERGETREEEEKNQKNKDHKGLEEKKVIKKEDEKKRIKSEEKRKKEEEKKRKEEEKKKHEEEKKSKEEAKRKHEEEKKHKEEEEKRKRKEEEQKKKEHLHNKRGTQVKSSVTPPNKKKKKKQRLLDEIAEVSPSAKRAMPVLSQLSPDLDKETEEGLDHSVTSAVREAAMVLLVTPLLIDSLTSSMGMDRKGSKLKRDSGRVRDVVNRYNTLNDMKPLLSNGDVTPLKRPRDRVDGPEEKPRRLDTAIGENEENNEGSEQDATIANDEEPSPATGQRRSLVMRRSSQELASSPSLQRLKMKLQDFNDGAGQADSTPKRDRATPIVAVTDTNDNKKDSDDKRTSSNMEEDFDDGKEAVDGSSSSREERVNKDFTSPIWRKTVIAAVAEKSQENKENEKGALNSSTKNNEVQVTQHLKPSNPQSRRRSSALPCEEMEEKLENLLNSATAERAKDSIKYMIGLFKQLQKHPKEEKYHRVFKGRVKFRKHVGIVRNAKLFLVLSGWTEIGSFFVFPLSKHVEEPLQLLNKYLSIAEEKRNEELSTATHQHSNLQRASSSDLAERIMELKDALVSARTTRKYSVDESKKQSLLFQRTVSSDEISRRKNTDLNSSNGDAVKKTNGLQKTGSDFEDDARNIRRSFSENSVYKSTENDYDSSSSFTPFQRTFSERSERDAGVCDVAMENPFGVKTASVKEKRGQASVSSSDDGEVSDDLGIRTPPRGGDLPRQVVSPREAVLEEADHLSSVLGNLIDSLGSSDVTEEEEGSEFEKEGRHTLVDGKPEERAATQHKDEELEALCETLSFLINDDSSDSTESADEVNANVPVGRRNLRRGTRCRDGAFKPPLPPTGRTTKRLDKAKSADETTASKRSSRTNGGVSREKVSKARSLDVTATRGSRNNSGKGEVREMIATRSSTSKINHKNSIDQRSGPATIGQRSGPVTRAQRQKEASSSQVLGTSRVARNKQSIPNKRDSGVVPNGRETKRVDSKRKSVGLDRSTARAKSVDLDRSKARPQAAKSKSVDLTFKGEQRNRIPSSKQSQGIRRSGTLSSSEEDKKKPGTRNAAGTTRVLPASKSTSKGKKGLSSTVKSGNRRGKSTAGKKSGDMQRETSSSDVEIKSKKSATVEDFTGSASDVAENTAVHLDGNDVKLGDKITISGSTEAEPAMICHKNLSGRDSGIQTDMDDYVVMDNVNTKNDVESEKESYDVEITKNRDQNDETQLVASEPEDSNGIVKLSKEIQSYYSNDTSQASRREADVKGIVEDDGNGTKAKQWFPSDSELRAIIQETEGSTAVKEGASEHVVDGPRDEPESQHKDVSEDQTTVTSATSACRDSKQRNKKKMLSDIGRQPSRGSSKKEVVAFTVEERKQQILEAGVTAPKAKPADKRRSILQIKNRGDGNLVKNTKEAFEKPTADKKVALQSTEMKSAKQRHFRFRGRKKKSFESANGPVDVVSEAQEELREETPVTNGSVKSDQSSHSTRLGNGIGLEQAKTSPVKKEEGDTAKGKRPSPVRLSPFRLPFTKRRGSYDLESNSPEITQESPQHYTSENE